MPLNLPDKLPAIELLKEENIFVIDNSRATQQDIRPLRIVIHELDAAKDYNGNGLGASAFQYSASGGNLVHEDKKPYFQEHSDRTHENILYGFRQDAR